MRSSHPSHQVHGPTCLLILSAQPASKIIQMLLCCRAAFPPPPLLQLGIPSWESRVFHGQLVPSFPFDLGIILDETSLDAISDRLIDCDDIGALSERAERAEMRIHPEGFAHVASIATEAQASDLTDDRGRSVAVAGHRIDDSASNSAWGQGQDRGHVDEHDNEGPLGAVSSREGITRE